MKSSRNPLAGDFNSKPRKYSTPVSKQTASFQTSPISAFQSPIFDPKVVEDEKAVCQKEEEFLSELKEFHVEVSKFEKMKDQLTISSRKLAKDSISLLSLASNLSVYQQKLEQRANIARQILSDPIDDLDCEIRVVEQLEKDLAVFKEKVPQPPSPEEIAEVEDKLHQAEQLQKTNSLRSQVLEKRRVFLEGEEKQINAEMKQYQALQEEENQKSVVDNDNNLTNAVSEENDASKEYIRQLQLKKEEHLRKRQALDKKTNDLNDLEIQIQDEKEQHQKDLDELQKKLDDLQEMKSLVDKEEIDLNEISGIRAQLEIDHADTEQELARMKRLLEAQKEELAKVERKKNELDKRKAENENKKKQIEEKTVTNSQRREVLSKAEEEYNVLVDELDEAKRALAEKQAKLAKEQAVVNDYQAKIREINGGEVQPLDEEKQADENQPTEGGNHESEPFAFV